MQVVNASRSYASSSSSSPLIPPQPPAAFDKHGSDSAFDDPPPYGHVLHTALVALCSLLSCPGVTEDEGVEDVLVWASLHLSGCGGVVDMVLGSYGDWLGRR